MFSLFWAEWENGAECSSMTLIVSPRSTSQIPGEGLWSPPTPLTLVGWLVGFVKRFFFSPPAIPPPTPTMPLFDTEGGAFESGEELKSGLFRGPDMRSWYMEEENCSCLIWVLSLTLSSPPPLCVWISTKIHFLKLRGFFCSFSVLLNKWPHTGGRDSSSHSSGS